MFIFSWINKMIRSFLVVLGKSEGKNRDIFRFWNGEKLVYADPMVISREINSDPEFSFDKHWPGVIKGEYIDIGIAAAATRRAFGVNPLGSDGKGLNEAECIILLDSFCQYCESVKKNISSTPTLPQPTPDTSTAETSTTNCDSDSGSTLSGPCIDELGL